MTREGPPSVPPATGALDLERPVRGRRLSIVVVMFDMLREAERTLHSLSVAYQRGVDEGSYEVVVVDNGSRAPLPRGFVEGFGGNFRLLRIDRAGLSPVAAIREGVATTTGDAVAIMVDGARMLSPGVVAWTMAAMGHFDNPAVVVPSWHLGPDVQNESVRLGYDQSVEDALLATFDWRSDGYRLFDLCERLDPSSEGTAWFKTCAESNFVCCERSVYERLGGFDARFTSPGGGACNLDFFRRLVEDAGCLVVSLVGEATFHQFHGGVSTNVSSDHHPWAAIHEEYAGIRGRQWAEPEFEAVLYGTLSEPARRLLARSPNIFTNPPCRPRERWLRMMSATLALRVVFWFGRGRPQETFSR